MIPCPKRRQHALSALVIFAAMACAKKSPEASSEPGPHAQASSSSIDASKETTVHLQSSAFQANGKIPKQYTCEGSDTAPPLSLDGIPAAARSLALIVDDPDAPDPSAPRRVWVHWVLYDVPPDARALGAGQVPEGALEGKNDWGTKGYRGPCPPIGRHRYFFKLYALDVRLPDLGEPNKASLEAAMHGHVLAQAELVGTYQKGD